MPKLIIIEDETAVLEVLSKLIKKADPRFEVCGLFSYAEDALEYMKNNHVDAVISDICLPGMSGLEFCRTCHKKYPGTLLSIISAYSKFEYAQEAISCGVISYILKPITAAKTKKLLSEIYDKIMDMPIESTFAGIENNMERIQIISDMLSGDEGSFDLFFEKLSETGVSTSREICKCAVLTATVPHYDSFLKSHSKYSRYQIFNIMEKLTYVNDDSVFSVLYNYQLNLFRIFIFTKRSFSAQELEVYIKSFTETLTKSFYEYLNLDVILDVENISSNIYEFYLFMQKGLSPYTCAESVVHCIYSTDMNAALSYLNSFTELFKGNSRYINVFYNYINKAIEQILDTDEKIDENDTDALYGKIITNIKYTLPKRMTNNNLIDSAIAYIEKNISSDISLESTAAHCFLSPAYFSMCFKNKTGKTFSTYLSDLRLSKAKSLLAKTNIPINNIADMCGFNSASYFHRFFKRQTGMTPLDYKNLNSEESNEK